jgi:outer membrane lipoprotein-sorting protein
MTSLLPTLAGLFVMGTSPFALTADFSSPAPGALTSWAYAAPAVAAPAPAFAPPAQDETASIVLAQADVPTGVAEETAPPRAGLASEADAGVEADGSEADAGAGSTTTVSATERRAILKAAANSLASAKTAKGRFTQLAPDGSVTKGDFALRRPGRMRFDYDEPTPILIVANGTTVAMEDRDLETVDRVPLASTPLGLILDDQLDFETEARVTDVQRTSSEIAVTMEDRRGEAEGALTLYFDPASYQLLSWRALDANQQVTRVALQDIETNVEVSPRLFRMDDPADSEEDER